MRPLRLIGAVVVAFGSACASRASPRPPITATPIASDPSPSHAARPGEVPFEVLDVPVLHAAEVFTEETGRAMHVDAAALPAARCLRISVEVPSGWRLERVVDAFELALAGTGLEVAHLDGGAYLIVAGPRLDQRAPCVDRRDRH